MNRPSRLYACLLVSGAIGAGKSTVARLLAERNDAQLVSVRQALASVLGLRNPDRRVLQEEGARLDRRTLGRWLADYLEDTAGDGLVVVDALRTERQTTPILERIQPAHLAYLDATAETRAARYMSSARSDPVKAGVAFADAMKHQTERDVTALRAMADLVIETDGLSAVDVVVEVESLLGDSS